MISLDGRAVRRQRRVARALFFAGALRRPVDAAEVRSVVHVAPALFGPDGIMGGGERYSYALAQAVSREIQTTLVSFGTQRMSWNDGELRVEVYPYGGNINGQLFDPLAYRFLACVGRADVVHCSHYWLAVSQLAILMGAACGKRTFATDLGGVGLHFDPVVPVHRRLSGLMPISCFSRDELPETVPSRVIYGGATETFLPSRESDDTISHENRRVLFVGRIMRHKGIDTLIRALPTTVGLDVVGHVYDDEFYSLLQTLAVGRDVRFNHDASDDDLFVAYNNALVTVLPSVYRDAFGGEWTRPELLGNVLLESMARETPVICSRVGGMPEIVEDGVTGFVVPPSDPDTLRERIGRLVESPALRAEMGACGRERVLERFTWTATAKNVVAGYTELAREV